MTTTTWIVKINGTVTTFGSVEAMENFLAELLSTDLSDTTTVVTTRIETETWVETLDDIRRNFA